jgi:predicted metal-binding membrane protein
MAALFALGVMSLTWMAFIAVLVTVQKLSPRPTVTTAVTCGLLAALSVGLLAAPEAIPGLVIPGRHAAMATMRMG